MDPESGTPYYFNNNTGASVWELPTAAPFEVVAPVIAPADVSVHDDEESVASGGQPLSSVLDHATRRVARPVRARGGGRAMGDGGRGTHRKKKPSADQALKKAIRQRDQALEDHAEMDARLRQMQLLFETMDAASDDADPDDPVALWKERARALQASQVSMIGLLAAASREAESCKLKVKVGFDG